MVGSSEARFSSGFRGYDPEEVDRFVEEAAGVERELRERVAELELENAELGRELARLRGEFDAARSALPEIEDLHAHLERLREEYTRRSEALQLLIAAAAREIGERAGVGPPPRPASLETSEAEATGPPPASDPIPGSAAEAATSELEPVLPWDEEDEELEAQDEPGVLGRPVWRPDVAEPVRGDWWSSQPSDEVRR